MIFSPVRVVPSTSMLLVLVLLLEQSICYVSCWITTTTSTINTLSTPFNKRTRITTQHNTLLSLSGSHTTGSKSIISHTGIHHLLLQNSINNQQKRSYFLHQLSNTVSSNNNNILATSDLTNKIIYQRVFYSLCSGSDVDIIKSIVIEERKRYIVDPNNGNRIIPIGPISLLLRNGNVNDENEIGTDFYTMNLPINEYTSTTGSDPMYEVSILTALYLASNPLVCTGQLLHVGIDTYGGFGTILGCIGASYVLKHDTLQQSTSTSTDKTTSTGSSFDSDDILTMNTKTSSLLPNNLDRITLTDENTNNLDIAMNYCSISNIKETSKLLVEQLQWRIPSSRSSSSSSSNRNFMGLTDNFNSNNINEQQRTRYKEYNTIIACGLDYTYPEAKEMAKTIANRVECISRNRNPTDSSSKLPRFLNIVSENRNSGNGVSYLRSFLEKGYKMSTSIEYLKLEKLVFQYQIVPIDQVSSDNVSNNINYNNEENVLDELELELLNVIETNYQTLVSIHHPDYIGGGSGEYFFPMDTGEYFFPMDTGEYDSLMSSSSTSTQPSPQTDPSKW